MLFRSITPSKLPQNYRLEQRGQSSTSLYRRRPFKGVYPQGLSSRLLFYCGFPNPSFIKDKTQAAVINIVSFRIFYRIDVSYANQHTFSYQVKRKWWDYIPVFKNYKGSGMRLRIFKKILNSNEYKRQQLTKQQFHCRCWHFLFFLLL